mmetsp:Transcript_52488/g.67307  ORF Transcript_52488/g.67307 Transcript_52488/m.67307 type:complete len:439 (-) Transcript_52488:104-1420(-)|eukprot:CAMPEP_0114344904 /NCGR_PEP_ID=MMETSP0101-20121206/11785_1 /TAXON_ID=38822 ORGANISM="Pteridomonas danica, Strain PT" /NCGR_SAMPLE_ID=MMETSP0101 /ASSEMBLY_ACC=CAM_ASM_000211 /LENGTH=438 /DNA_ID=CAMNT_0001480517 /DNA_START=79 /DNA_END=1395 /DNA_ORIENTATION=+
MADNGLRRRGQASDNGIVVEEKPVEKMTKMVKKFDMYAKVKDEYKVKSSSTITGGYLNKVSWVIIAILTLSESWQYLTSNSTKEHMLVDSSLGQKLRINVNISFPALSCTEIHVDAMDVAGDYHPYMEQDMKKQRLRSDGQPIGIKVEEQANVYENKGFKLPDDYCGSCYGAETAEEKCCNTCESVISKYSQKGWATKDIRRDAEQCKREQSFPLASSQPGEGCNLAGFMLVNKVAGNFHVALGESVVRDGRFIHQFQPQDAKFFNASHIIHELSFGDPYPGMPSNPLDSIYRIASEEQGTGLYQYFIKLVPTIYEDSSGDVTWTNQFSFTERFRPLAAHLGGHPKDIGNDGKHHEGDHNKLGSAHYQPTPTTVLPGVFWVYDLSAFMLNISHVKTPFTHFFARLCAIAGGVFTVTGLIQSGFIYAKTLQQSQKVVDK